MKKVFYYTDVLPLLDRNREALDKIERSLSIFHESKEKIQLVWHPWSKTVEYLKLNNSDILNSYIRVVQKYRDEGWGVIDESDTFQGAKSVLFDCDAYYGDVSNLAYEAQLSNMPVMLQNYEV